MNKEIIKLTKQLGDIHIKISKLQAERHVIIEKIWAAKTAALNSQRGLNKNDNRRLLSLVRAEKSRKKSK